MAAQRGGTARRRARSKGNGLTVLLLIVVPMSLLFMPTAVLLAVGLVPTAVAFVIDRDPDKTAPMTVGALNFVGVMVFAIQLWQGRHSLAGVMTLLGDPFTWLGMYGAAAVGWALYYGIPPAVAMWTAMRAETRIARLREHQQDLAEEWGPEVRGEPAGDAPRR
ncbi:hypothetical protein [Arenibaculum sp.]|uniref:hypothetical protein n=1 Tax=Arenibaculum sp. TaxID=2865862 RepID=UPI002E153810|nr:hypothetical protein [Arenibaculum sp.]